MAQFLLYTHMNVDIHQGYKLPHQDTHDHCLFTIETRTPHISIIHQQVFTARVYKFVHLPHPLQQLCLTRSLCIGLCNIQRLLVRLERIKDKIAMSTQQTKHTVQPVDKLILA